MKYLDLGFVGSEPLHTKRPVVRPKPVPMTNPSVIPPVQNQPPPPPPLEDIYYVHDGSSDDFEFPDEQPPQPTENRKPGVGPADSTNKPKHWKNSHVIQIDFAEKTKQK